MSKRTIFLPILFLAAFTAFVFRSDTVSAQRDMGDLEVLLCNPMLQKLEMGSTWEAAKAIGVKGIEVHVEPDLTCSRLFVGKETPYRVDSPEAARRLQQEAAEQGLHIPVLVAPLKLDQQEIDSSGTPEWALTLIEMAPRVGASLIYFPIVTDNFKKQTLSDDSFLELSVYVLNDLVAAGRRFGISVAFENLSVYWNRPEITKQALAEFNEEELGICLDPVNFYWYGHPLSKVTQIVQDLVPRAWHFHAKNVSHPAEMKEVEREPGWNYSENSVPVADGDLDFEQLIRILLDSGYNGYISIEDDSLDHFSAGERREVLKRDVEYIQRLVRGFRGGSQ